jgi:hypothetical protein
MFNSRKSLFLIFSILVSIVCFVNLHAATASAGDAVESTASSVVPGKLTIHDFQAERDVGDLRALFIAHDASPEREWIVAHNFENIMRNEQQEKTLRLFGVNEVFGTFGLYYQAEGAPKERMVGYVTVEYLADDIIAPSYAECCMLLHPELRGRGMGTAFRKLFLDEVIIPRIGIEMVLCKFLGGTGYPRPLRGVFPGVKSIVAMDNIASRKMLIKSGYGVYDLRCDPANLAIGASIIYVYPPIAEGPLSEDLIARIKTNDPAHDADILEHALLRQEYNEAKSIWLREVDRRIWDVYKGMKKYSKECHRPFSEDRFWQFVNAQKLTGDDSKHLANIIDNNAEDFPSGLSLLVPQETTA